MTSSKHWRELKAADKHPKKDPSTGCLYKHKNDHKPSKQYPACAFKANGYDETKGLSAKKNLYELDTSAPRKGAWKTGAGTFRTAAERLKGLTFAIQVAEGRMPKSGKRDEHQPVNPTDEKGAWDFTGQNYKQAIRPFFNEYHHILPAETVFECLDHDELVILQDEVKYNLNSRKNIIILPCTQAIAEVLGLPVHQGRHGKDTQYAQRCTNMLNEFKKQLSVIKDTECKNTKMQVAAEMKAELERWQQQEYWLIVRFGRTHLGAHINDLPTAFKR
ncbi:AHH domain-containing protein [Corallococcus terminator]